MISYLALLHVCFHIIQHLHKVPFGQRSLRIVNHNDNQTAVVPSAFTSTLISIYLPCLFMPSSAFRVPWKLISKIYLAFCERHDFLYNLCVIYFFSTYIPTDTHSLYVIFGGLIVLYVGVMMLTDYHILYESSV